MKKFFKKHFDTIPKKIIAAIVGLSLFGLVLFIGICFLVFNSLDHYYKGDGKDIVAQKVIETVLGVDVDSFNEYGKYSDELKTSDIFEIVIKPVTIPDEKLSNYYTYVEDDKSKKYIISCPYEGVITADSVDFEEHFSNYAENPTAYYISELISLDQDVSIRCQAYYSELPYSAIEDNTVSIALLELKSVYNSDGTEWSAEELEKFLGSISCE